MDVAETESRLAAFIGQSLGQKVESVKLTARFSVGAARSSYAIDVAFAVPDGPRIERYVVKQDPLQEGASLVPGSVMQEYDWYTAIWGAGGGVLMPEPVLADRSGEVLGSPFMIARQVDGISDYGGLHKPSYDNAKRQQIALQAFEQLGRIAGIDVSGFEQAKQADATPPWQRELDCWQAVLDECELGPLPMVRAGIHALRANPPPPPRKLSVVHGDFRFGNFLYTPEGVQAILDWEMTHVGDAHEDLGWALKKNWRFADQAKIWGFVDDEQHMLAAWEQASGLQVDRHALHWWTLLNHIKAAGLWLKGAHAVRGGTSDVLTYLMAHWQGTPYEEAMIAQDIRELWT
ncbi:MAG: phosphotransferase family protein [Pseudoxanthomonas sp.]